MKLKDLVQYLHNKGFYLIRTSKHHIYSNGSKHVAVPTKRELNRILVKHIIKQVEAA